MTDDLYITKRGRNGLKLHSLYCMTLQTNFCLLGLFDFIHLKPWKFA